MNRELTVVITTFNRKGRLIAQLNSLFRQASSSQLNIIICDNCSEYDLDEVLKVSFSNEQASQIQVVKRPLNIGMIGNISNAFVVSDSKWMWLLSDDDETTLDSISIILNYIEDYPNVAGFKFTEISDSTKRDYVESDVTSIPKMLAFCKANKVDLGNFIFMSNNIYNMELLRPYLDSAFKYSYTYFPHMIPILLAIDAGHNFKFVSNSVVNYKKPENEVSSDYLVSIYLGALSISDIQFNISLKDFMELRNFFRMNVFWEISNDFFKSTYQHKRYLYKKIYRALFGMNWSLKNMLIYWLFDFQMFIGNNSISNSCFSIKEGLRKFKIK